MLKTKPWTEKMIYFKPFVCIFNNIVLYLRIHDWPRRSSFPSVAVSSARQTMERKRTAGISKAIDPWLYIPTITLLKSDLPAVLGSILQSDTSYTFHPPANPLLQNKRQTLRSDQSVPLALSHPLSLIILPTIVNQWEYKWKWNWRYPRRPPILDEWAVYYSPTPPRVTAKVITPKPTHC